MEQKRTLNLYLGGGPEMSELVLVDTSIWVTHFREGQKQLTQLLEQGLVACHPFIVGELACGSLKNRGEIIQLLEALPIVDVLEHTEIMEFIESRKLMSMGIGYIDTHLLGSSLVSSTPLWTYDKSLIKAAKSLKVCFDGKSKKITNKDRLCERSEPQSIL